MSRVTLHFIETDVFVSLSPEEMYQFENAQGLYNMRFDPPLNGFENIQFDYFVVDENTLLVYFSLKSFEFQIVENINIEIRKIGIFLNNYIKVFYTIITYIYRISRCFPGIFEFN